MKTKETRIYTNIERSAFTPEMITELRPDVDSFSGLTLGALMETERPGLPSRTSAPWWDVESGSRGRAMLFRRYRERLIQLSRMLTSSSLLQRSIRNSFSMSQGSVAGLPDSVTRRSPRFSRTRRRREYLPAGNVCKDYSLITFFLRRK